MESKPFSAWYCNDCGTYNDKGLDHKNCPKCGKPRPRRMIILRGCPGMYGPVDKGPAEEMNNTDQTDQEFWEGQIGQLPEGFFAEVRDINLWFYFNGPGYKEVTECSGERPPEYRKHAFLGSHTIYCDKPEESEMLRAKVVSFVQSCVKRTQEELSALSK